MWRDDLKSHPKMAPKSVSEEQSSFCRRTKNLEKNTKANVNTLVTVCSESTRCNEIYIGVKLNKNDIQKSHRIQNPVVLACRKFQRDRGIRKKLSNFFLKKLFLFL